MVAWKKTSTIKIALLYCNNYNSSFLGVKPLIHQSELRTYTNVIPFKEKKFPSLCCIVKNTEWNGIINIDNWS